MPPSNITSNHPLVRDVLPNLPLQIRLYPQSLQRILARPSRRLLRVRLRCSLLVLRRDANRLVRGGSFELGVRCEVARCVRDVRGCREESGECGDLHGGEVADPGAVVDLVASAYPVCGGLANPVEIGQRMLMMCEVVRKAWTVYIRETRTLTNWFSGKSFPRICMSPLQCAPRTRLSRTRSLSLGRFS